MIEKEVSSAIFTYDIKTLKSLFIGQTINDKINSALEGFSCYLLQKRLMWCLKEIFCNDFADYWHQKLFRNPFEPFWKAYMSPIKSIHH